MSTEPPDSSNGEPQGGPAIFAATRWTVVMAAGKDDLHGARALEQLCRTYWLPLYSYVRRQGYGPHDAQDLTQGFFARLLRMNSVAGVSPDKGRFRTFLLASLNHFLSDERDHARAGKRGGGQVIISLDDTEAEQRGAIRLGDTYPDSVEEIPVGQKCRRLHFLHAGGAGTEQEPDNTQVASYVLHYADGSQEEIPVLYGQDLRSWVVKDDPADVHGAKVAWSGIHSTRGAIRIFMQTWENPHPDKELQSVDFVSKKTKCVPILFGISSSGL